ncbi:PREDICTED: methyltransferase-like protein 23 [Priapulus caudatus]|uniref:Methyltransferase-like protein 23 n=1 Tax=Priapulus caudatus TaxID=37621 RepID=A0ABM1EJ38_PRICU|nr:PREDICTED: methyltransferase-like protein 23 [Priapulus caudatus]XP_014672211.1 PREDICTED: methyltransferase-like protein 23 [Priapulus caudatus]XP_014672212.1 PREDICTED: methyltransferase-like protein 23 [Priapulus caudatus]
MAEDVGKKLDNAPRPPQHLNLFAFKAEPSSHHHGDERAALEVFIPECVDAAHGAHTWPSAPVLAQYVWQRRREMPNKSVLELGAGTALAGVVAAKCGAHVAFSDDAHAPACLDSSRRSCEVNGVTDAEFIAITWGRFTRDLVALQRLDFIMASDCFYDARDYEDIVVTVSFLLDKNPGAKFWCAYQERGADESIEELLQRWEMKGTEIPLASFHADSTSVAASHLPGRHTIRMLEITKMSPYTFVAGCVC